MFFIFKSIIFFDVRFFSDYLYFLKYIIDRFYILLKVTIGLNFGFIYFDIFIAYNRFLVRVVE